MAKGCSCKICNRQSINCTGSRSLVHTLFVDGRQIQISLKHIEKVKVCVSSMVTVKMVVQYKYLSPGAVLVILVSPTLIR